MQNKKNPQKQKQKTKNPFSQEKNYKKMKKKNSVISYVTLK
jgi:hypothetical protein